MAAHNELDYRNLLQHLNLQEQISLLSGRDFVSTPGVPRLDIPPLKFADSINGIRPTGFHGQLTTASFPNTTCLGSTWNVELLQSLGEQIAHQARIKHAQVVLGPTINIHRDARAGRNFECFSEDPLLSGYLAAAIINGIQDQGVGTCPKHFVCNDSETHRHDYDVTESPNSRTLREIYLAAWQHMLRKSNPTAVMMAYNKVNGTHCTENDVLIEKILREEWGFDGAVISDWFATRSTAPAIKAGLDLEMPFPVFRANKLLQSVADGTLKEGDIDRRVLMVLEMRNKTRSCHGEGPERSEIVQKSNQVARQVASEGIILLQNLNSTLPLQLSESLKVAVVGEYAQHPVLTGGGSASCKPQYRQIPLELLREAHPKPDNVRYASGVRTRVLIPMVTSDILTARDGRKGVDVTYFNDDTAEPLLTEFLDTPNIFMLDKYKPSLKVPGSRLEMTTVLAPPSTGNHILAVRCTGAYSLLINGVAVLTGPVPDITTQEFLFEPAKYESQVVMAMGAGESYTVKLVMYSRDLMVGEPTPYGATLCFEEEYSQEDAITEAVELAAKSDVSIIYAGRNEQHESEGFDMTSMDLPDNQISLIKAVAAASGQTVLLLHCGNPIDVSPFIHDVDAILDMHFPGQEGPGAVVDILTGKVNPSGRLPTTWFKSLEASPSFSHFPSKLTDKGDYAISYTEGLAVGYRAPNMADHIRWPFGYGLSYTTFEYNDLQVRLDRDSHSPSLKVTVSVTNTGKSVGKEVVQVYVCPKAPRVWRPERELRGFTKVSLSPGQSKTVEITVDAISACSYWDEDQGAWRMDEGVYEVEVAGEMAQFKI